MINPLEAIQVTLGINKKAAILAAGGFIVLSLAISAYQIVNDDTATLWYMLFALVMLILLMMFLTETPFIVRRSVGTLLAVLFSAWVAKLVACVVFPSFMQTEPICVATLNLASMCRVSSAAAGEAVTPVNTLTADAGAPVASESINSSMPVFIQFSGYKRSAIVDLASALTTAGWSVSGRDKGGERTVNAAGLSEVRYFNPADKPAAEALAASVLTATNIAQSIQVKDLSKTQYAQPPMGHLEIWLGQ